MRIRRVGTIYTNSYIILLEKLLHWTVAGAVLMLFLAMGLVDAAAQAPSGALTGTVLDQSGGVIPGATVVLKSEDSGSIRRTESNKEGFFTIVAVPAGTYPVTVQAGNFTSWEPTGTVFHQ